MSSVVLISGSDSLGLAGMEVDVKTVTSLGVRAHSIVTAVTAQTFDRLLGTEMANAQSLDEQLKTLPVGLKAVKIGMLGDANNVLKVADFLKKRTSFVVLDPVLATTSGYSLLDAEGFKALKAELFPFVDCLTPNLLEAEKLLERPIRNEREIVAAAADFLKMGPKSILIKGGHRTGEFVQDYWSDGRTGVWLTSNRLESARGTGCALSSAIAAMVAKGESELDAVVAARACLHQAIRLSKAMGPARALHNGPWPVQAIDFPWITESPEEGRRRFGFRPLENREIGFYPIVDRAEKVQKLTSLGVLTIQLRIKDLQGEALMKEIAHAVTVTQNSKSQLFINDFWEMAIQSGAYGVHLGQEDLRSADLAMIERAGLRLGVSTHSYAELSRAVALRPSYVALGPIFPTKIKAMKFPPQGVGRIKEWTQLTNIPLVAIGGITLEKAKELLTAGADGVCVISDLESAPDWNGRANAWLGHVPA